MSINTVAPQRNARNYCTVAELVARERAAYTPYRRPRQQHRERQLQPVTELLRREGIEFSGEDTPTIEMPTTRIHVSQLRQRGAEPTQGAARPERVDAKAGRQAGTKDDKRRGGRFGAISSAAVLCGLTVAGLIALKPTIASGPADTLADAAGTPGDQTTSEARVGGVQPTSTVLNASNAADTSQRATGGAAQQQSSVGGGVRATQQASEPRTAAPGPSRTVAPVPADETQQSEPTTRQSEPSQQNEDDGGLIDDTVDTVDDTVETVDDTLDPVTGTITGTLDGMLG
ncbi:hypothetical protein [Haloechinothrix halophila]|uniref:hypothetical protein n=1 Tax=Haloechinothrix halophila TaxID=1069073 RepID=UPI000414EFA9|nr:hypothetical protein [Haloechinothrix halophila]